MKKILCKRIVFAVFIACEICLTGAVPTDVNAATGLPGTPAFRADYNQLQIPFVKNEGQVHTDVSFYTKTRGGTVFVTEKGELVFSLPQESEKDPKRVVIKEVLQGAKAARPRGEEQSAARVNYFKGADLTAWRTHIPTFDRVTLGEVYTGIELALKTHATSVEKLFLVKAGADPAAIRIQVEGIQALSVTESGELALTTGLGTVTFTRPVAYQEIEGKRVEVAVAYQLQESDDENKESGVRNQESEGNSLPAHITPALHTFSGLPKPQLFAYCFKLGEYNKAFPLTIDPMLSTYLGGSGLDCGYALDTHYIDDLYVYVTGYTESDDDFPGLTGVQTDFGRGGRDVFIARLDHDLRVLDATYLGGSGEDEGFDIACHYSHHYVYVVGFTDSTDFPTAPAAGRGRGGEQDAFITRFTQDLSAIEESRYLGGTAVDQAVAMVIDDRGDEDPEDDTIYLVGRTNSNDFPSTAGSAQPTHGPGRPLHDGFVARLTLDLAVIRASYLGGGSSDSAAAVDMHPITHDVYVAGSTSYDPLISDGMRTGAFPWIEPTSFGGQVDTFVVRMAYDLINVLNATYLGGYGIEFCSALDINYSMHKVYVAGGTSSVYDPGHIPPYYNDFPVNGYQTDFGGEQDAYIARFSSDLTLEHSTYLGGTYFERAGDLVLDQPSFPASDVYILGSTESSNFPGTDGGADQRRGGDEAFVALLNDDLTDLEQATYVGGSGFDESLWHGLDLGNNNTGGRSLFVTGQTSSSDFPAVLYTDTDSTAQPVLGGSTDAFVARITPLLNRIGPPDIELQPRDHDFGNKRLNLPATPRLTVTIENMGGDPLTVSDIFLTGEDQEDYGIDFTTPVGACGNNQPVVASGEYCTITVGFTPSVDNDYRTAELVVQTENDPDEPEVRITLSGYSGPDIAITPAQPGHEPALDFPVTQIGTNTQLTFTINNVGYSDLSITGIQKTGIAPDTGEDFTFHYGGGSQPCPDPGSGSFTLAPNNYCTVDVEFSPTAAGPQEALAIIFSNDLDENPAFVHLLGTGVTDLDADIWSHDVAFHDVVVGNSRDLPLIISNTGGETLEITGYTLSDPTNFSHDPNGGAIPCASMGNTLPSTDFCTMTMTFNPQVSDTFDETLTIHSNDPDNLDYAIHLTGRSGTDGDGDGVLDIEEAGDTNSDGTPDSEQAHVASLHSYDGEHFVVIEAQDGATLEDVHAVMAPDPPAPGFSFPFGFFHFTIVLPPGEDSTILTVTLPDGETADTWLKNGPEPCNTLYHYYDFGDAARCPGAVDGVNISGNVITLHFTDSEDGDSDLTVNSRVVDPGAPAMVVVSTTTTTAASTTSTTAASTTSTTAASTTSTTAASTTSTTTIPTTSTTAVSSTTTSTPPTTAPTTTTSVACTSNDDCDDDGAFCNGDEVCIDGFCDHSGDPCQEGTTCVEESDQCVPVGIPCDCTIVPSTAEVASNESLHFSVSSAGDCLTPEYEWVVESAIGSGIDQSGNYQAGRNNNFFKETTDLVRVVDHANSVSDEATVSVYRECFLLNIYGENSKEIKTLRGFRDGVLNKTPHGQALISLYYQWSPLMVRVLAADEEFKEEVKDLIDTIVLLLESSIN